MADGSMQSDGIIPNAENARIFRDALGQFRHRRDRGHDHGAGRAGRALPPTAFPACRWTRPWCCGRPPNPRSAIRISPPPNISPSISLGRRKPTGPPALPAAGEGFDGLDWQLNAEGVPILPQALARFDCRRHATHDGGDHLIIVGHVLRLALEEGEPLVFAKGRFGGFTS